MSYLIPWKMRCPSCGKQNQVYHYDNGIKLVTRFLVGDNRFACRRCKITWRRRDPGYYHEFKTQQKKFT